MKLNTQKVVYLGILGLAAVAFAADRWVFGPAAASAQPVGAGVAHAAPKIVAAGPSQDALAGLASLSSRLTKAAGEDGVNLDQVKDVFRPSAVWAVKQVETAKGASLADEFREKHQLLAVMSGTRGGIAIINGKTVRKGQTIDGFRLTSVREKSAVFENADGIVELALKKGADASTDNAIVRTSAAGSAWGAP
jgi:biotin carboxyl carrier protein